MNRDVHSEIKNHIAENNIMLYMKGTREEPMCGFSAQVIQILNSYGQDYQTSNILDDWDLREGIKSFSNWPTIPQLYVKGEFIGGCDIIMELHRKGELDATLTKIQN
ncbi:MAG: Grx4 family monothiol glutaredoxin [Oligoflexales bacterium]